MLNDIALIKLKVQVQLNPRIQIACLPPAQSYDYPGVSVSAWIVGWGQTTTLAQQSTSNPLQSGRITTYDTSACANVVNEMSKDWRVEMCAGDLTGTTDACVGDSGLCSNSFSIEFRIGTSLLSLYYRS